MLKSSDFSEEELLKKREEAERKARRGEIDPVQEYTFSLISKITGLPRPAILNFMFEQPLILDELDLLYKTDTKKRVIFYYQVIIMFLWVDNDRGKTFNIPSFIKVADLYPSL